MSWTLTISGGFDDPDRTRENEVRLDELVRDFVETLREEIGEHNIGTAVLSGGYVGSINYVGPDASEVRPESPTTPGQDAYLDESVVADGDDDGLGDDAGLPGYAGAPDAGGDHPGDVLNPANEDLAINRSVPSVELRPNPEDMLGEGEGYSREDYEKSRDEEVENGDEDGDEKLIDEEA